MPRTCTVCSHAQREAIDTALVGGQTLRYVSETFGLSEAAVYRHKATHLPALLAQAEQAKQAQDQAHANDLAGQVQRQEAASQEHALDVVKQLRAINSASLSILAEARKAGDPDVALKAVDRIQRQIELQAKLIGELDERPVVNLVLSPEWLTIRGVILTALVAHPEARLAVAEKLATLEGANGHARG